MEFFSPQLQIPWHYWLIDSESKCVLVQTKTINVLRCLAEGALNVGTKAFAYENIVHKNPELDLRTLDYAKEYFSMQRGFLTRINEENITDRLREKKNLLNLRAKYLNLLEIFCAKWVLELSPHHTSIFSDAIAASVKSSDANSGNYHPAIQEYAKITKINNQAAYTELKLFNDSVLLMQMRSFAIFQKFSQKINLSQTESEMNDIYLAAEKEIFFMSRV